MKYSNGSKSKFISDRSGMEFPYNEQRKEWNGSIVHTSEYEEKHPQLDPKKPPFEPQTLKSPRSPASEPQEVAVAENVFGASGSLQAITSIGTITVTTS
tara:strand:+ start:163 stop:459 length:297 start_codon:yes stop_codon:yes gene_type:complete